MMFLMKISKTNYMIFFIESESDDINIAVEEFDNDYEESDLRLYRLKIY